MKGYDLKSMWENLKRRVSILIIISMVLTGIAPATSVYAEESYANYTFAPDVEVMDEGIEDDMFYIPHKTIEAKEGDENNKFVFKVVRKGEAKDPARVKLTMLDITGKYDRDYSIRVIDKAFFSENVKNGLVSKSVEEFIRKNQNEEYNTTDAIIDGSLDMDEMDSEKEDETIAFSDEMNQELTDELNQYIDELKNENDDNKNNSVEDNDSKTKSDDDNVNSDNGETKNVNNAETGNESNTEINNEENVEVENEDDVEIENGDNVKPETEKNVESENEDKSETNMTVGGFAGSESESKNGEEENFEETENIETTSVIKEATENTDTTFENIEETDVTISDEPSSDETTDMISFETEADETTSTTQNDEMREGHIIEEETTTIESTTEKLVQEQSQISAKSTDSTIETDIASYSEIIYGTEKVEFEEPRASMSMLKGYEMATGLVDDRKVVKPDRASSNPLDFNPNSLENPAFGAEGIENITETLKSAYVILEYKMGQTEKLIEITIKDDRKYWGKRQVGFNLYPVDGSVVAGMYSSLTLEIEDNEEKTPTYINFSKNTYSPKDGYITIDVERSGDLSNISTCMLDSFDETATHGKDYSKVHTELIFTFGMSKRTIKIPIVSNYIKGDTVTFKLKLQEATGALIGDNGEATCKISKSDKNLKIVDEKIKKAIELKEDDLFGSSDNSLAISNDGTFGARNPVGINSIVVGPEFNLEKNQYFFEGRGGGTSTFSDDSFDGPGKDSKHEYKNGGKGLRWYVTNKSLDIGYFWVYYAGGYRLGEEYKKKVRTIAGLRFNGAWSQANDSELRIIAGGYTENNESKQETIFKFNSYEDSGTAGWARGAHDFIFKEDYMLWYYNIYLYKLFGITDPNYPTLDIESIQPIYRMYRVNLNNEDVPMVINGDGERVRTDYSITSLVGAEPDGSTVTYAGQTVTVKLDNKLNNIFRLKALWIQGTNGKKKKIVESSAKTNSQLSFQMNEDFAWKFKDEIKINPRDGGGFTGEFTIIPEVATTPALVHIVNDDRVDIKIWDKGPDNTKGGTGNYNFVVGDTLHFNVSVKSKYKNKFTCDGLNIYPIKPVPKENEAYFTQRRPIDGSDFFPLEMTYEEIRVVPLLSDVNNRVVVRVKTSDISHFDRTYGLFATTDVVFESGEYTDYYIEPNATKVVGRYFDLKARCKNSKETPVWYESYKGNKKYMQDEYFFLGLESAVNNTIYLTYDTPDDIGYSIKGATKYEDLPIGGKITDAYTQAAECVSVIIDESHFTYSNEEGNFSVMPSPGKLGYYKKLKLVSNGVNRYVDVELNQNKMTSDTYVINDEGKIQNYTGAAYSIDVGDIAVSNTSSIHPHVMGVRVFNLSGTRQQAQHVTIGEHTTVLSATVKNTKLDGSDYIYTYVDDNGKTHEAVESIKRVEFVVVDPKNYTIKKVIEATYSNADKTEWEAYYPFVTGHYNEYKADDKLYVRVVTNKKVGNGKGDVIKLDENGKAVLDKNGDLIIERKTIPMFNETVYQAMNTTYQFIEPNPLTPEELDLKLDDDPINPVELPLIGSLNMITSIAGVLNIGITKMGNGIRIYLGVVGTKLKPIGNRFNSDGSAKTDGIGYEVDAENFMTGFKEMTDKIRSEGDQLGKAKTSSLGMKSWTLEPFVGGYFEFQTYNKESSRGETIYEFTGGGGYFGGIFDLRVTNYFAVYCIPFYIGLNLNTSLSLEFGVALDKQVFYTRSQRTNQGFFDAIKGNSHFEFIMRAIISVAGYGGIGICGTFGARAGVQLTLHIIWNPTVADRFNNVRPVGVHLIGYFKVWLDLALFTLPVSVQLGKGKKFGYFEDVDGLFDKNKKAKSNFSEESTFGSGQVKVNLMPKPRFGGNSEIVANEQSNDGLFGGTYYPIETRALVDGVYDLSEPKLMQYDSSKALLVYLDDDGNRGRFDRTVLRYMLYDGSNTSSPWSVPSNNDVWFGNDTADFSPYLLDAGDRILVTWVSRPNPLPNDFETKEALESLEIYATFFDKTNNSFVDEDGDGHADIIQLTNDNYYDSLPKAVYDSRKDAIHLYYLKASVSDINNAEDFLNNAQPDVNGAHLMYMTYADIGDGQGKRWLTDYYYDFELSNTLSDAERQAFINEWRGQRFKNLSTDVGAGGVNNPSISDYDLSYADIFDADDDVMDDLSDIQAQFDAEGDTTEVRERMLNFMLDNYDCFKSYSVLSYVVEGDGNIETSNDTEIYLKLQCATESTAKTIRLTNNNVSDTNPKMVQTATESYILWIQDESMIKMVSINDILTKIRNEDHVHNDLIAGNIGITTTDKLFLGDKISNYVPFVDENENIFIIWQQNPEDTKYIEGPATSDDAEMEIKQDLLIAGLIVSQDEAGNTVRSWSNPVYIVQNKGNNNIPAVTKIGEKLLTVNNQYTLKSEGELYNISNSKLNATVFEPRSSLEPLNINSYVVEQNDDGSIKYRYIANIQNTGLFAAEGYDYTASVIYDQNATGGGAILATNTSGSSEYILPGNGTSIEGEFTLTKEQQNNLDKVILRTRFVERNIGDSQINNTVEMELFNTKEQFDFVENYDEALGNRDFDNPAILADQEDGRFVVSGILKNTGNLPTRGNEKIYVYVEDSDKPIAVSDYIDLPIGEQLQFEIPISIDSVPNFKNGGKDIILIVKNDSGDELSREAWAILNIDNPYNFKVNGDSNTVRLKVGETITLNTTYEPSDIYQDTDMTYIVTNKEVAINNGNTLYGVSAGETTMQVSTKEYGGREVVKVIVESNDSSRGGRSGRSVGGGGGGVGPTIPSDQKVRTSIVNTTKTNTMAINPSINPISWIYDPISDKFRLNVNVNGQVTPALNGFYEIIGVKNVDVNGITTAVSTVDTYYFDNLGNMITGWVKTADDKWYFFENLKTINEGKMALGWTKIENIWYYFIEDGSMLRDAMTPDGHFVGNDGAWIAPVITTNIN